MEINDLKKMVIDEISQDPSMLPAVLADKLNVSEGEVVSLLPPDMAVVVGGEHIQSILEQLPEWGPVTSIIHSFGSIFEVKAPFPKGKVAHGYYNLMGKNSELHGHLKLDLMDKLALVSKPFRGKESYYFGFFDAKGNSIFKIYLGRDNKRVLLSDQVEKFKALQLAFTR